MTEQPTINIRRKDISDDEGAETTIKLSKKMENPDRKATLEMIEENQDVGERREAGIRRMYSKLQESSDALEHPIVQKRQKEDETREETLERLLDYADRMMG